MHRVGVRANGRSRVRQVSVAKYVETLDGIAAEAKEKLDAKRDAEAEKERHGEENEKD